MPAPKSIVVMTTSSDPWELGKASQKSPFDTGDDAALTSRQTTSVKESPSDCPRMND